jgi:hypothetical protein
LELFLPFIVGGGWLFHPDHFSVYINHDLKSDHAQVDASVVRDACLNEKVELFVDVFKLALERGLGEDVFLPEHFGGLFGNIFLTALHHPGDLSQDHAVDLLGRDVPAETQIIDDIAGLAAYKSGVCYSSIFIYYEAGKEGLARRGITSFQWDCSP